MNLRISYFLICVWCVLAPVVAADAPFIVPKPPVRLDLALYQSASQIEDVDTIVWTYLCSLIPEGAEPFRDRVAKMLRSVSPELRRYYLTRGFDWERGSGGLEGCMMRDADDLFLQATIAAYESLGAPKLAAIIRELIPIARAREIEIAAADRDGKEFDFSKCPFEAFKPRWDAASIEQDFYKVIFADMKKRPDRYSHP